MFKGLITPCKKCVKEECGLWVVLTWKNEQTKEEEKKGECAITGMYNFMARIENRAIATQQASEESRNNSANVKVAQEVLGRNIAGVLTKSLNAIAGELKLQVDTAITYIEKD